MASDLYVYGKPADSVATLTLDNGQVLTAPTTTANGREDAHVLPLPPDTGLQGSVLTLAAPGRQTAGVRGIVRPSNGVDPAEFLFDDFGELAVEAPPPEPPPGPEPPPVSTDPWELIQAVYATGQFSLATTESCGQFVEACCTSLHDHHSVGWVHDRRTPPQNSYNGHAVDACQCIVGAFYGMYDLIQSSVSPDAQPMFGYVGPPNPSNACYPAGTCAAATTFVHPPTPYGAPTDTDEGA